MRIRHSLTLAAVVLAALMLAPATATAETFTIGDFAFDNDLFFGPSFTLFNTSNSPDALGEPGGTFTLATVHLLDDLGNSVKDIDLSPVGAGLSQSTFEDLSLFAFSSATIDLAFSLAGTIQVDPIVLTAADFADTAHLDSFVHFTPIPEPSTLLLIGVGVAVGGMKRRRA